jgi:lysozyme
METADEKLADEFEGDKLTAYQDIRGIWTIGRGHTGPEVHQGLTITQAQSDQLYESDHLAASTAVTRLVKVPLTDNERAALNDFVFNCGPHAFLVSTLLTLLNKGDYRGAAEEFDRWDKCAGKEVAGLLRRRQAETTLFEEA